MLNKKLKKAIESGENIFLTGQAGTGKSFQVHRIVEKYSNTKKIALTSTTGIAAQLINGQTLHSFLNLGMVKTDDIQKEVSRIVYNPYAKWEQVRQTDILIIDEVSMLDGFLFSVIDNVMKTIRKNNFPFGGCQIILVGDLYQLPPVESETKGFFFDSDSYKTGTFTKIILTKVYRQNDKQFIDCLNRIRLAKHTKEDIEYLKKREFLDLNYALLDTTCLYPTNKETDILNKYRLANLEGEEFLFESNDMNLSSLNLVGLHTYDSTKAKKILRCPEQLKLKSGARVILLTNLSVERGLCNGSIGHFKRKKGDDLLIVEFNGIEEKIERRTFEIYEKGKLVFKRNQYPFRLGWAISIHSSQGMSLDSVAIDLDRVFSSHQAYVSLSRVRSYEGLYLKNISANKIFVNQHVVDFMEKSVDKKSNWNIY